MSEAVLGRRDSGRWAKAGLRDSELRVAIQRCDGSVLEGFVLWTGDSPTQIAGRAGVNRASVYHCLSGRRKGINVRRTLEATYGLSTYTLDTILGED